MTEKDKKLIKDINEKLPYGAGSFKVRNGIIQVVASIDGQEYRRSTGKKFDVNTKYWIKNKNPKTMLLEILGVDENGATTKKTVANFAEAGRYILEQHIKKVKNVSYKKDIWSVFDKYIEPRFGKYAIQSISAMDIITFFNDLSVELSGSRVHFIKTIFSLIFKRARDSKFVDENPFNTSSLIDYKINTNPKKRTETYTKEEVQKLIKHSHGWFKVFLDLIFKTGSRPGEIMALKWSDIDLENGVIYFKRAIHKGIVSEQDENAVTTKNHNRLVVMMESSLLLLKKYYEVRQNDEWVFVSRYDKPFAEPKNIIDNHFKPLLKKLEIKYKTLKSTRTTNISILHADGVPLESIQARVGHKIGSKITENHYIDKNMREIEQQKEELKKTEKSFIKIDEEDEEK